MARGTKRRVRGARLIAGLLAICALGCSDDPKSFVGKPLEAPEPSAPAPGNEVRPAKARLTWTGCGISKMAYMASAAEAYKAQRGIDVIVTGGGATRGIRATAGGRSDLGGSCRMCLPGKSGQEAGVVLTHVAWDALVFFTHRGNEVKGITLEQAKAILLGKISNWKELGGPDRPIVRMFRRQTSDGNLSGVGYMTRLLVFNDAATKFTTLALFEHSSGPVERFVEQTEYSFAVTGVSSAQKRNVRILELDGVAPNKETIANGSYKLFRPLYLVTQGEPAGMAKDFVDWLVGEAGQAVISASDTVSLKEGRDLKARFRYWPKEPGLVRNY